MEKPFLTKASASLVHAPGTYGSAAGSNTGNVRLPLIYLALTYPSPLAVMRRKTRRDRVANLVPRLSLLLLLPVLGACAGMAPIPTGAPARAPNAVLPVPSVPAAPVEAPRDGQAPAPALTPAAPAGPMVALPPIADRQEIKSPELTRAIDLTSREDDLWVRMRKGFSPPVFLQFFPVFFRRRRRRRRE